MKQGFRVPIVLYILLAFSMQIVFTQTANTHHHGTLGTRTHGVPPRGIAAVWNMTGLHDARERRRSWSRNLGRDVEYILNQMKIYPPKLQDEDLRTFDALGPVTKSICKDGLMKSYSSTTHKEWEWDRKKLCGLQNYIDDEKDGCLIYSIGSNNQWGFEEGIHAATNCHVRTFDCTVGADAKPLDSIKDRVTLYRYCLGEKDETIDGMKFLSYQSMLNITGEIRKPTVLKMDIEGWEWDVLPSIIKSEYNSLLPDQISFELHYVTNPRQSGAHALNWHTRYKTAGEVALLAEFLWRHGNYYLLNRDDNTVCGSCTELLIARADHAFGRIKD